MRYLLLSSSLIILTWSLTSHLSTKTIYEAVRGDVRNITRLQNSKPHQIWFLARHGSRNFGQKYGELMNRFLDKLYRIQEDKSWTVPDSMEWFKDWDRATYVYDKQLVYEGMLEHFYLAQRYKEAFPELFPDYTANTYQVRSTWKLRAVQSAYSFMYGVTMRSGPLAQHSTRVNVSTQGYLPTGIQIECKDSDYLLRFFDNCPVYQEYSKLGIGYKQSKLFEQTPLVLNTIKTLSDRLGLDLTVDDAKALFYLCAIEQVSPTRSNNSQFCSTLSDDVVKVIEFGNDLKEYYGSSYPNRISYEISCVMLQELLDKLTDESTIPYLRFAHSETVLPLLTLLGLYEDQPILSYQTENFVDRKMVLGQVLPFAANIAFVKYKAVDGSLQIQIIVNERVVSVPGCNAEYCTKEQLELIIDNTKYRCNFEKMCTLPVPEEQIEFQDYDEESAKIVINRNLFYSMVMFSSLAILEAGYIMFMCIINNNKPREIRYQKMPSFS